MTTLYELPTLRRLAGQIARVSAPDTASSEVLVPSAGASNAAPVLLMPGAFNPPTIAHLALAEESLRAVPGAQLYFSVGTTVINKERTERATLPDRLLLLEQIARRLGSLGVVLTNRGLYLEQAAAARAAFPQAIALFFVVGYDKIEQIFDARYYQERDKALRQLLSLAGLLAAPRAGHEADDVAALLNRPENRPFQTAVRLISLPIDYRDIASSQIRAALETPSNHLTASPLAHLLPPEALAFCHETGCYSPPERLPSGELIDRYGIRTALIAHALALPEAVQVALDLLHLFQLATSDNDVGRRLRRWLSKQWETISSLDLLAFQ